MLSKAEGGDGWSHWTVAIDGPTQKYTLMVVSRAEFHSDRHSGKVLRAKSDFTTWQEAVRAGESVSALYADRMAR